MHSLLMALLLITCYPVDERFLEDLALAHGQVLESAEAAMGPEPGLVGPEQRL